MTIDIRPGHLTELETGARRLATVLKPTVVEKATIAIYQDLAALPGWLAELRSYCRGSEAERSKAADWLLDNDFQVLRAIRQVSNGLPKHFFTRLPVVINAANRAVPRVFEIALDLSSRHGMQMSMHGLVRFLRAFQEITPLTTAELWALPSMLRLANLEMLAGAFKRLPDGPEPPFAISRGYEEGEPADLVTRAIINLTAVHGITWNDFFDQTSPVEKALAQDPAGIYGQMDFPTRDRYRKTIEQIADWADVSDIDVAAKAIGLATAESGDPIRGHVGYWLIDKGRTDLEAAIDCQVPPVERLRRHLFLFGRAGYAAGLVLVAAAALAVPAIYLYAVDASLLAWCFGIGVALLPATVLSVSLIHWLIPHLISPHMLPALDLSKRIPQDCATAVAVPVIVSSVVEVDNIVSLLETRMLANPDPMLRYVLLSDPPDAPTERLDGDEAIERALVSAVRALNRRHGDPARDPFLLLHRHRRYNPGEACWMSWERKRGKLDQFNRLVLGESIDDFAVIEGRTDGLRAIRFVITLDADTMLPPGSAARLIGILAHPLNTARFDEATGRIVSGYSILQPRMEILPDVGAETPFSHLYSGDTAIDIYTHAVSDVYQDLFETGIFVGKGIYEVAPLQRCLEDRIPENTILSHDLFEGLFCRAALVTNVVLYENFPSTYAEFAWRQHRWLRGDWQLVPWLGRYVRTASGKRVRNPFNALNRWKIIDNLRRSLVPPSLLLFFIGGWMILPGSAWLWTLLAAAAPGIYLVGELFTGVARVLRRGLLGDLLRLLRERSGRWFLAITFLVSDTIISVDAIARTLWRVFVSRRHMLEWRTAAHTAARITGSTPRGAAWRFMWPSSVLSAVLAVELALHDRAALLPALPVLALWLLAPEIAAWTSRPRPSRRETLDSEQSAFLTRTARQTWHFFEAFAGPEDHWLPPDNFQENPHKGVAHRTSPTNIGLLLVSVLSARDFGFIGTGELTVRCGNALAALDRMETYRGHWLNWYETRNLTPLEPRYVSTVDSGNLAICLVALKNGCQDLESKPAADPDAWNGLSCLLDLLQEAVERLPGVDRTQVPAEFHAFRSAFADAQRAPLTGSDPLDLLINRTWPELQQFVGKAIEGSEASAPSPLSEVHVWLERFDHHLRAMQRDLNTYMPWLPLLADPPADGMPLARDLKSILLPDTSLRSAPDILRACQERFDATHLTGPAARWHRELRSAVESGLRAQTDLLNRLRQVEETAETVAFGMDFKFLYNPETRLFRIGYNLSTGQADPNHYDLLATEARLASFFAIAKNDVPIEHWFYLGRPITRLKGKPCILSWNGSMFEYLMPPLFLPGRRGSLLGESESTAVEYQRRYALRRRVPWGISESAFSVTDAEGNYQYRAFGAPGLGIRRGLTDDLVIAPYASALALSNWPRAAVDNLGDLAAMGATGVYGFIESLDFTPDRVPGPEAVVPVHTHMAHHQGMIFAAITNVLKQDLLVERVLRDKRLRAVEYLLQERVPWGRPTEKGRADEDRKTTDYGARLQYPAPWIPSAASMVPQMHVIGNGRMSMRMSSAGGGGLFWNGLALTRWRSDPTGDRFGYWIYIRDTESDALWSIGRNPTRQQGNDERVVFHQHMIETMRRDHGITTRMETTVAPGADVEIRRITVTNEDNTTRTIEFTSYAEVVLAPPLEDERHPTFSKLFIRSTYLPEREGLLFERRPRRPDSERVVLLHRLVAEDPDIRLSAYETDRRSFLGRGGSARQPDAVLSGLSNGSGWTLDPVMALQLRIRLAPLETKHFSFVTIAAGTAAEAIDIALRYQTPSFDWVLREALQDLAREIGRLEIRPSALPDLQALSSLLMQPCPALRQSSSTIAQNRRGQPDLWRFGISGDLPILLVRTSDESKTALLDLLVRAQQLWRRGGLRTDVVVLRTGLQGYEEPIRGRVLSILQDTQAYGFLGRSGGIHLLSAGHMDQDSRHAIESAALVILDEDDVPLRQSLDQVIESRPPPPQFEPPLPGKPDSGVPQKRPEHLDFDNGYGGFDTARGEYCIYLEPGQTIPAPWCNVLANEGFGSIVSEAGLGFTWAVNSGENRLTPWSNDPVCDRPGEVLYLRDEATAEWWTATPAPRGSDASCRIDHGCGYTRWVRAGNALEQELLVFAPVEDPVKIVRLRLRNPSENVRRLTVTYYAEWILGALDSIAAPRVTGEYDAGLRAIMANNAWNPEFAEAVAFLTASHPPRSVSGNRYDFLGREGDVASPAAMRYPDLGGRFDAGADPCAAYQVQVAIGPEQTEDIVFILGQGPDRAKAEDLIRHWQAADRVDEAFDALRRFWSARQNAIQVETPDPAFDLMVNRWLPYQTLSSRVLARAGFYQAGGAFGYRDQLQDMLALFHSDPQRVRNHILEAAKHQFEEGDALHWWHPPTGRGVRTHCSDDYLWLPYVTARYVRATGDTTILDEDLPFLRGPELRPEQYDHYAHFDRGETQPLYEHCARALDRMITMKGRHGLPLIGTGDWNDGMDRVGVKGAGESVWLAWFQIAIVGEFAGLAAKRDDKGRADRWRRYARRIKAAIDAEGWDGEWFIRAFDDDGKPWGSHDCDECKIDSIAQSWSVLSGVATEPRMHQALQSALHKLVHEDDRLIKLLDPPFDATPRDPGYIKAYPPGVRENGGQYTHSAAWLGLAFAEMGDGDTAWRLFDIINPIGRTTSKSDVDRYRREPYVVAADISSLPNNTGLGGWTWYTGAAAWTWLLGVEGILGVRLDDGAIRIDPHLPKTWGKARLALSNGEGTLDIHIEDPEHAGSGVAWVKVEGRRKRSGAIAFPAKDRTVKVVVRLGQGSRR